MTGRVLFQMWGPFRDRLVAGHLFYVEQARKRLLSQFADIDAEANQAAEEFLEQSGEHFDPDRHDPGDFYEAASEAGFELYELLSGLREQTRLNVAAGMFHEWDKQLRRWLTREMKHWHRDGGATAKVWSVNFVQLTDLLESFGWRLRGKRYHRTLDAFRLVVNVYKHGDGQSLEELKTKFPEYLTDPFGDPGGHFADPKFRDHTDLKLTDEQIQEFSDAILEFWRDVPESVLASQVNNVPQWFEKAILADRAAFQQADKI